MSGAAAGSWEASLPRLTGEDVEWRRRAAPLAARLRARGPSLARALPAALDGVWPFGAAPARTVVRLAVDGPGGPREVELDRFPAGIGRAETSALVLEDTGVSSEHARIEAEAGLAALVDLRSTNGTRLNGESLAPHVRALLRAGDRIEVGSCALRVAAVEEHSQASSNLEVRATPLRLRRGDPLGGASASERWAEVRWGGHAGFVRLTTPWLRAFWTPLAESVPATEPGPLEEGAAQFAVSRVACSLGEAIGEPVEAGGWLLPDEVAEAAGRPAAWLESEAWITGGGVSAATRLLVPVADEPPPRRPLPGDLLFPARVSLGWVRLRRGEWAGVVPGDALLPDFWWPEGWAVAGAEDLGAAYLRVGSFWCGGRLMRSGAGARFRIEQPWFRAVGGEWLVADENPVSAGGPLPVEDLEVQISVELDRFPATLAEIERWCAGEVLALRQGPGDPVRLVMETGLQRRVLAEGRVVVVDGRLGIEILRILAPAPASPPRQ
jgi:flagellar motor switch/type III secretory pathway protein FliN